MRLLRAVGLALALLVSVSVVAPAGWQTAVAGRAKKPAAPQPKPVTQPLKPWEDGSTKAQRDEAHKVFAEGNELFFKRDYVAAIERFERAAAVFDHPRIRLALARTLIRVGRPADAHPHVVAALRWDAAPFDAEEYAEAIDQRAALAKQLSVLVIRCTTEGARMTLDGKDVLDGSDLLACPGEVTKFVTPGPHQIVAKKPVYLSSTQDVVAAAGLETRITVELKTLADSAVKRRRWKAWKPWAVVAGGGLIALAGVPLQLAANRNMTRFLDEVEMCGSSLEGCTPEHVRQRLDPIESRAKLENRVAISLWLVGGAVAASGLVMVYVNREHLVIPDDESSRVVFTPVVSPDLVGIGAAGAF